MGADGREESLEDSKVNELSIHELDEGLEERVKMGGHRNLGGGLGGWRPGQGDSGNSRGRSGGGMGSSRAAGTLLDADGRIQGPGGFISSGHGDSRTDSRAVGTARRGAGGQSTGWAWRRSRGTGRGDRHRHWVVGDAEYGSNEEAPSNRGQVCPGGLGRRREEGLKEHGDDYQESEAEGALVVV